MGVRRDLSKTIRRFLWVFFGVSVGHFDYHIWKSLVPKQKFWLRSPLGGYLFSRFTNIISLPYEYSLLFLGNIQPYFTFFMCSKDRCLPLTNFRALHFLRLPPPPLTWYGVSEQNIKSLKTSEGAWQSQRPLGWPGLLVTGYPQITDVNQ